MYKIKIERSGSEGVLKYTCGSITVSATCWWDAFSEIPEKTYHGCSATTMKNKLNSSGGAREGIFIPNVTGFSEIFIHMGKDSSWSDGCIVIKEVKLLKIYNDIKQKNGHNVTVVVTG